MALYFWVRWYIQEVDTIPPAPLSALMVLGSDFFGFSESVETVCPPHRRGGLQQCHGPVSTLLVPVKLLEGLSLCDEYPGLVSSYSSRSAQCP
jgi:hypothetical protein